MSTVRFADIETEADLEAAFGCSLDDLSKIAQASDQLAFYTRILIPKRGRKQKGQHRIVYKPTMQALRLLQKNIATALSSCTEFDNCVQGVTAKRSIVTNAKNQLGAKVLMHADIKDVFESIKASCDQRSL